MIYSGYWKTMKAKIVGITFALVMMASGALSQSNSHFDVLETKQGNFTNALIYPANASGVVVNYDGGIAAVPFTNLSPALQKQLGYDPMKAAAEAAALIQRKVRDNRPQSKRRHSPAWLKMSASSKSLITLAAAGYKPPTEQ